MKGSIVVIAVMVVIVGHHFGQIMESSLARTMSTCMTMSCVTIGEQSQDTTYGASSFDASSTFVCVPNNGIDHDC